MATRTSYLRWLFYGNVLLIVAVIVYKGYVNLFEGGINAVHSNQVERIEKALEGRSQFRFAVVGNINNSIGIFERKIIPMLNNSGVDFVISAGDAVSSGAEDKYRALYKSLSHLKVPYLLAFGENENSSLGGFRFYDHFGPYVFSFTAGDTRFVFLDSTGKTDIRWQQRWLADQFQGGTEEHAFVVSAKSLVPVSTDGVWPVDEDYLFDSPNRAEVVELISQLNVDAVFSAGLPVYASQKVGNTYHITTGGAGGFIAESPQAFYHYLDVEVTDEQVNLVPVRLDIAQNAFWRTVEGLWLFIHSLFYVGYLNFLLILSGLWVSGAWLYNKVMVEKDYYPNFDLEPQQAKQSAWRVAMFTNNYLPFIGGVPVSIARLRQGLIDSKNEVLLVAPRYKERVVDEPGIFRVPSLLSLGARGKFSLANIFSWSTWQQVRVFKPDVVHVHHPFWLGSVGVWVAKSLGVPVIYTYHTRLEHYSHYVPLPGPLFRNLVCHSMVKRFANRCDAVIVPTESAEEYLRTIGVKRPIFVEPTGIEFERFRTVEATEVDKLRSDLGLAKESVLLTICRLSKEKNIDFLVDGIKILKERHQLPFKVVIVGDGPERARLDARLRAEQLHHHVVLAGNVAPKDIPLYCQLADLFIFSSVSETQGMVILEAMAAGLPVVTVRSSGISDIVEEGVNGFKTAQDQEVWAEKIKLLLQDEALRRALGANALETARDHDIEQFTHRVTAVYAFATALADARVRPAL